MNEIFLPHFIENTCDQSGRIVIYPDLRVDASWLLNEPSHLIIYFHHGIPKIEIEDALHEIGNTIDLHSLALNIVPVAF